MNVVHGDMLFHLIPTIPSSIVAKCGSLESRDLFTCCIKDCDGDAETLQAVFIDAAGNEGDKKSILEQAFRDVLRDKLQGSTAVVDISQYTDLVLLAISSAQLGFCYHAVPFILLSDILDCITLDICELVFEFVENQVSTWAEPEFYSSGKILLLRMCNDLLRRLSSAQNTVFCGRIQLFLARLFPLSEKSALNLMSHFNLENVTTYNKKAGKEVDSEPKDEEAMDVETLDESLETSGGPIDFNLYHKLWSLHDFFRQPTQCYLADQWKILTANAQEVLQAFASFKLEDVTGRSSHKKTKKGKAADRLQRNPSFVDYTESHYFAKFLTSEKLMNLQLQDSHFRRHILVQLLILFQYLNSDVKFKSSSHVTSDAQAVWIQETSEKVYKLLEETPPNGSEFAVYIKQALKREENWIAWKNDGCPSYEKAPLEELKPQPLKPHLGDTYAQPSRKIDLGNPELSRLWNLCPDNLEACKAKSRVFTPELGKFLEEPVEQADPAARIESEYKLINNPNFTWQALRLLSQESSHFFQNTTAQIRPLPEYLEHVIVQTGKEMPNS